MGCLVPCAHCRSGGSDPCVAKVPIFAGLSREELYGIAQTVRHRRFAPGDFILWEGQPCAGLFIINQGKVKLTKLQRDGREQILHILREGDFFGESALLCREEYNFNAAAVTEVQTCTILKEDFERLLLRNPEIALKILQVLGARLTHLETMARTLSSSESESRLACLLWDWKKKHGRPTARGVEITLPLNRGDIANYIGVTRETVSRKLSKMQAENIIRVEGHKKILLLDEEKLLEYL